jgi:hypothetical protein
MRDACLAMSCGQAAAIALAFQASETHERNFAARARRAEGAALSRGQRAHQLVV